MKRKKQPSALERISLRDFAGRQTSLQGVQVVLHGVGEEVDPLLVGLIGDTVVGQVGQEAAQERRLSAAVPRHSVRVERRVEAAHQVVAVGAQIRHSNRQRVQFHRFAPTDRSVHVKLGFRIYDNSVQRLFVNISNHS